MKTRFSTRWPLAGAYCLLAAILLAGRPQVAAAQGWLGLALSNYGGTHSTYVNPSAIADARYRAYLNVVAADASFYNTYLQLNLTQKPWEKGFAIKTENLTEQGGSRPTQQASLGAEVQLPSLVLALGPRSAVAFTNRVRGFAQASDVSTELARLVRFGLGQAPEQGLANRVLTDNQFLLNVNAYHEFALTYARTLTPEAGPHFFKAGLTLKYLVGLGGGYLRNDGTSYQVYGRDSVQLLTRQLSYGATDYKLYKQPGFSVGALYGSQQLGRGYGADLGLTYEWRPAYAQYRYQMDGASHPDRTQNQYRLRLGLALTDLGALAYRSEQHVRQGQLANTRTVQLSQLDTIRFRTLQSAVNTLQRITGLSSEGREFTSYLPAALRLTADYHVAGPLYTGLLWVQSLLPARSIGSHALSTLAVVPRVEFRRAELALPVVWGDGYRRLQLGAMLRLGPLVVGSDNLLGLLGLRTATGADAYLGLAFTLGRHYPRDRDHDAVSNRRDKCPGQKGPWECQGCPDRDGDHVPDQADQCPDEAGPATNHGCPEADPLPAPPAESAPAPAVPAPVLPEAAPATPAPVVPALQTVPATPVPLEAVPAAPAPGVIPTIPASV